jgi:hypothetical protein
MGTPLTKPQPGETQYVGSLCLASNTDAGIGPVDSCYTPIVRSQWDVVNLVNGKTRASSGFQGRARVLAFAEKL